MLECVINISEGRRVDLLDAWMASLGPAALDRHTDPHHHRSVFTMVGEAGPRLLARAAVEALDLAHHDGVHPRIGVVDVVPFVALGGPNGDAEAARAARDAFARWAAGTLGVPCFLYGPERTLPEIRRTAWRGLGPDVGPEQPHPTAGAMCVGVRDILVAYNVWLVEPDLALARRVAAAVRGPAVRALGLPVGGRVQVSMNLIAPDVVGPAAAFDAVATRAAVAGAELVGLLPQRVLDGIAPERWGELGLDAAATIEARLRRQGYST